MSVFDLMDVVAIDGVRQKESIASRQADRIVAVTATVQLFVVL